MKCLVVMLLITNLVFARKYERCELAKELYEKHNVAIKDVGMWVCLAEWSSSKLETGKSYYGFYGLFHLDGLFWCSNDDTVKGCDMKCSDLIDDDITDDVKCVKQMISVQGFDAWGVKQQCLPKESGIVNQCFPNELHSGETQHVNVKDKSEEKVQHTTTYRNPESAEFDDEIDYYG